MAVTVRFLADFANYLSGLGKGKQGTKDFADDVEGTARKFIELSRQAGRSTDEIANAVGKAFGVPFDRAKKAVEQVTEEADHAEQALGDMYTAADEAGTGVGEGVEKGATRAGDSMNELGSIVTDVLKGDFGSAASSAIDSLGSLAVFAGVGGGLAVAVAGGLAEIVGNWISEWNRANEESQKRVAEWANAYLEAGNRVLTAGVTAAKFQDIITDPEKFKQAEKNAENWGVAVETAVAAMAGNKGAIDDVTVAVKQQEDATRAASEAAAQSGDVRGQGLQALTDEAQAYQRGADALAQLTGEMATGSQRAQLLNRYYEDLVNSAAGATKEVDELGNELYTLPDGTQILVSADTGQATQDVSKFKGDVDGIPEVVNSKVKFTVDDSAVRNYRPPVINIVGKVSVSPTRQLIQ